MCPDSEQPVGRASISVRLLPIRRTGSSRCVQRVERSEDAESKSHLQVCEVRSYLFFTRPILRAPLVIHEQALRSWR